MCYRGVHRGETLKHFKMQVHTSLLPGAAVALRNKIVCLFSTVEYTCLSVPGESSRSASQRAVCRRIKHMYQEVQRADSGVWPPAFALAPSSPAMPWELCAKI